MRELKFRAWFEGDDGKLEPTFYDSEDLFDDTWTFDRPYCIDQFVGILDKNGKEIYEGDIIQEEIDFDYEMTDGTFKYRVYWNAVELCWALEHIGNKSIHDELWECNSSLEVIGNIYENKELYGEE